MRPILRRFLRKEGVRVLFANDQTTQHDAAVFRQLRIQATTALWMAVLTLRHTLALHARDRHVDQLPHLVRG